MRSNWSQGYISTHCLRDNVSWYRGDSSRNTRWMITLNPQLWRRGRIGRGQAIKPHSAPPSNTSRYIFHILPQNVLAGGDQVFKHWASRAHFIFSTQMRTTGRMGKVNSVEFIGSFLCFSITEVIPQQWVILMKSMLSTSFYFYIHLYFLFDLCIFLISIFWHWISSTCVTFWFLPLMGNLAWGMIRGVGYVWLDFITALDEALT